MVKFVKQAEVLTPCARRNIIAWRRISPCHQVWKRYNSCQYLTIERSIMDVSIGVLLVIGFPLALVLTLWLFGKVSVRPE